MLKKMSKRNLLYLVPSIKFFAEGDRGRVRHALGICEGFAENGWRTKIVSGPGLERFLEDLPVNHEAEVVMSSSAFLRRGFWFLALYRAIKRSIKIERPDLFVVRYAVLSFPLLWLLPSIMRGRTKIVIEVNSFAYNMTESWPRFVNRFIAILDRILVDRYDLVYVVSQAMADDPRIAKCREKLKVIPNGASSKYLPLVVSEKGAFAARCRLVYFGTLMPYWDFAFLTTAINALQRQVEIDVIFFGDGPEAEFIRQHISQVKNLSITGSFQRKELTSYLNPSADILLLPPKAESDLKLTGGLSTKVFDYLSIGLPIVAPLQGELTKVLDHRRTALLYRTGDITDFCARVSELVGDHELASSLGYAARQSFLERFSWRGRMEQLIKRLGF